VVFGALPGGCADRPARVFYAASVVFSLPLLMMICSDSDAV
jgi:hypothetical protein